MSGRVFRRLRLLALICVCWLTALPAGAHSGKTGYSEVAVQGSQLAYLLQVPGYYVLPDLPRQGPPVSADRLRARLGDITRRINASITLSDGDTTEPAKVDVLGDEQPNGLVLLMLRYQFDRPIQDLRLRYELFDRTDPVFQNLLKVHFRDQTYEMALTPRRDRFRQLAGGVWAEVASFWQLGVEHIFTGYDHIAFILGLLLLGGSLGQLLRIVSAFTVAHSLTLIAAALGVVSVPSKLVECAIALSIAYIALENWWIRRTDQRWMLAFAFGLVHGFGFSSALSELGLPTRGLVASLLSFNLGVETGQVIIVSLLFPLVLWSSRGRYHTWLVRGASGLIFALGMVWFVQRVVAPG